MAKGLAMHETLEVHEILTLKTSCVTKGTAMLELVEDEDLKKILEEDVQTSAEAIKELKKILKKAQ
ncbi:spore coat protein [Priestia megaterium]|jgi:similar to spore coat protein|uniref:spore coat protein n=1 Tax=Priestia megaterium TaxID=1404 RepID=UPI0020799417|nr:spore coat protein [Priestia megaterium]MCT9857566.1 spore coat protein [Priestia megaterium]MDF1961292.1 spore coat protein [Priestia megaterium]USL26258.1 spore coat protein [Priestia megaterium]USL32249.1 spore coat protein [Priestia megaterium]USL37906.1 spore coat protein [Priestia megaterium]